jgi:alkanesulfonate monooxygenase SsuD/methylene tetrahydromethanopterin reductase-like flavin-dependent oxidoreductase (luciferase family)
VKVSISLPTARPGDRIGAEELRDWAVTAEACGYWSATLPDRIVYDNNEPLIALSFVVGATARLGVITDILITPARETTLVAKQIATLDVVSGGRLMVGVGIGGRSDDYVANGRSTSGRGRRLEEQIGHLREIWSGAEVAGHRVGPPPLSAGGPRLLVGGGAKGIERAARFADGWSAAWPAGMDDRGILAFSGIGDEPQPLTGRLAELTRQWDEHGRDGRPYVLAAIYAAIGPTAREDADHHIRTWYGFSDKLMHYATAGLALGRDGIRRYLDAYETAGVDELCLVSVTRESACIAAFADVVPPRFLRCP